MYQFLASIITFVSCHGGSGAHFVVFTKELRARGHEVHLLAAGPTLEKCRRERVEAEEYSSIESAVERCAGADVVVTDVGHESMVELHKRSQVPHFAYYDNPEPFVPGGYSQTAARVMLAADRVLFSNAKLASETLYAAPHKVIPLEIEKRIAIGYSPLDAARKIGALRKTRQREVREAFLSRHKLEDHGQKILVYFGGNNSVFFEEAFPAFLKLSDALDEKFLLVYQKHPAAKAVPSGRLLLSDLTSDDAQIVADAALYYQTSMGPQFVVAGIPTLQAAHETYPDILVRNGLAPSVTTREALERALEQLEPKEVGEELLSDLGVSPTWARNLEEALSSSRP